MNLFLIEGVLFPLNHLQLRVLIRVLFSGIEVGVFLYFFYLNKQVSVVDEILFDFSTDHDLISQEHQSDVLDDFNSELF